MSDAQNQGTQDPNDKLENLTEEQARQEVIDKYGLDPDTNEDLITQLASDKLEEHKKFSTAIRQKIDWRTKAQEAEKPKSKPEQGEKETPKNEFTPKDYLALAQANVPADDLDEVSDYAKFKGISLAEALKSNYIKSTLKEKAEERKSAETANTGTARKSSSKASGEALLEKLADNPQEIDINDIEATVKARIAKAQK